MFAELKSRALVRLSGPEVRTFLQGLLSNDVTGVGRASPTDGSAAVARPPNINLAVDADGVTYWGESRISAAEIRELLPGVAAGTLRSKSSPVSHRALFAALLSPQGKILFDLILLGDADGVLIDCEAARADELVAKLKLYRLRAKIEIVHDTARAVFARYRHPFKSIPIDNDTPSYMDPRQSSIGMRLIGAPAKLRKQLQEHELIEHDETEYTAHRLALGVPEGAGELGAEKLFLLEANAEELHGVDLQKGCYVGQELTSRMKRKTELKKRLLPLRLTGQAPPGANVTAGEEILGQVIGGSPGITFALLRLDRLADARAHGTAIKIGETPAELRVPEYLAGKL